MDSSLFRQRLRVAAFGAIIFIGLGVLSFTLWALLSESDPVLETLLSSLILILTFFLIFLLSLCVTSNVHNDFRLRRGWSILGVAAISYMIGECIWFYYESILHIDPFPSLADPFYILFYPLTLAGLLLFPFAPVNRYQRRMLWLDLAIVTTTCAMFAWYFILAQLTSSQPSWMNVLGIAYPVGDILLLTGVGMLIQRDVERVARGSLSLLACALVFMAFADGFFAYLEANGLSYLMVYPNILWLASGFFFLFSVAWQTLSPSDHSADQGLDMDRFQHTPRLFLPHMAVVLGIGLLLFALNLNSNRLVGREAQGLLYGTLVLIGIVLLRQYIVLRENVNLYKETRKLACTDVLTGLYNRHFFNEIFPVEIKRADRYGKPLSILIVDIDQFKAVNDSLGHLKGDEILKVTAERLAQGLRTSDIIARFGGDEFVVLLPETDDSSARAVAERLKSVIARQPVLGVKLRVSVGMAVYQSQASPEQTLEKADVDLYRQKRVTDHGADSAESLSTRTLASSEI